MFERKIRRGHDDIDTYQEECHQTEQYGTKIQYRHPIGTKDVKTYVSFPIDVGMVNKGVAFYLWRIIGIGLWNVDGEFKASTLVQAVAGGYGNVESHEVVLVREVDYYAGNLFHFTDI